MDLTTLTPPDLERIHSDLTVARSYIAAGWIQQKLFKMFLNEPNRVCTQGAVGMACEGIDGLLDISKRWTLRTIRVFQVLLPHIQQDFPLWRLSSFGGSIPTFIAAANDNAATTKDQVLTWFDRAITEVADVIVANERLVLL